MNTSTLLDLPTRKSPSLFRSPGGKRDIHASDLSGAPIKHREFCHTTINMRHKKHNTPPNTPPATPRNPETSDDTPPLPPARPPAEACAPGPARTGRDHQDADGAKKTTQWPARSLAWGFWVFPDSLLSAALTMFTPSKMCNQRYVRQIKVTSPPPRD